MALRHAAAIGLTLATTLALAGCPNNGPTLDAASSGTVNGQVTSSSADDASGGSAQSDQAGQATDNPSSDGISGSAVVAMRVETDGKLTPVSGTANTDASGNFSLMVPAGTPNLILKATKDAATYYVIASQQVAAKGETTAKPMTTESSVEARVFASLVGKTKSTALDTLDLMERVSYAMAQKAKDNEQSISDLADSVRNEQEAKARSYQAQGESTAEVTAAAAAEAAAYAELSVKLKAATTAQAANEAYRAYQNALVDAYTNAGIALDSQMKASEAAAVAGVRFAGSAANDMKLLIAKEGAHQKARLRQKASEVGLKALNASQTRLSAAAQASVELHASIDAAADLAAVNNAFQAYHDVMLGIVRDALTDANNAAAATAVAGFDASIQGTGSGSARATLVASLSSATSAEAVVAAYQAFYAAVSNTVQGAASSMGSASVSAVVTLEIAMTATGGF